MMTNEKLWEIRCCWILPNGEIMVVPQEEHSSHIPKGYKTEKNAEDSCVKVSCTWGYSAPISEIYLPRILTPYQAQKLIEINESLETIGEGDIKNKVDGFDWNEILELR